ncbi:hypothetical protein [Clostridium estertheticum]|nr:hypothetical protein [Clostridium estertheticum]
MLLSECKYIYKGNFEMINKLAFKITCYIKKNSKFNKLEELKLEQ